MKKCKKLLSLIMAVMMLLSVCPVVSFAEDDVLSYLTYEINDGEVTITGCDTSISGDIVIPDTIEGYPVTTIGDESFGYCKSITSIVIPDSVIHIGLAAFSDCYSLESIIFSKNLIYIGYAAFWANINLKSVEIPDSVEYVGMEAFRNCASLESVYIGAKYIDDSAFHPCPSLKNITLSDNVSYIGNRVFSYCFALESITIPENVTFLGADDFNNCFALKTIYIKNVDVEICEADIEYGKLGCIDGEVTIDYDEFLSISKEYFKLAVRDDISEEEINKLMLISDLFENAVNWQTKRYAEIHGYAGSTAEAYALKNGFEFVELCEHNYISGVIKEPTVTEVGIKADVCEFCGDIINAEEIPMLENDGDVSDDTNNTETPDDSESQDNSTKNFLEIIIQFFQKIIEFLKSLFMR